MQSLTQVTKTDVIMGSLHYLAELAREKETARVIFMPLGLSYMSYCVVKFLSMEKLQ